MAFKEIRDLSEHLKQLDYPNNFTISSLYSTYGNPASFQIVADILQWLAGRLAPGTVLPGGTANEVERVLLIRSAAEFFVTNAGIKLNPRKLYASSAGTAAELLKITTLLMNAPVEMVDEPNYVSNTIDLGDKIEDLRRARELSSELTNMGASLYDLLAKELVNKETRNVQASRSLELNTVEKYLKNAIVAMNQKCISSKNQLEASKSEKIALSTKLDRKKAELERVTHRLEALQKIRPAFLEEFERLEVELKDLFDQYFIRVRCLDALRMQVQSRVKLPNQSMILPVQAKQETSSLTFLPDGLTDSEDEDNIIDDKDDDFNFSNIPKRGEEKDESNNNNIEPRANTRLRVRTAVTRGGGGGGDRRFVGNMMGGGSDIEDSSLGSENSDSEIDLAEDFRSDDDETIAKLTGGNDLKSATKKAAAKPPIELSDEDF